LYIVLNNRKIFRKDFKRNKDQILTFRIAAKLAGKQKFHLWRN